MENQSYEQHEEVFNSETQQKAPMSESVSDIVKLKFVAKKAPQYFASFAAHIGAFSMGTAFFWSATALPAMKKNEDSRFGNLTANQESWITSIVFLGALISGPIAGYFLERFGRRMCLFIMTLPLVSGWILIAFAQNIAMIYIGRFITGICVGSYGLVIPVFIAESSEVSIRGTLTCMFELMICLGTLYIYIVGTYTSFQIQTIACAAVPIVGQILMMFIPESPRYLLLKGKLNDATLALGWFRGSKNPEETKDELNELTKSIENSRSEESQGWRALKEASVRKPIFIGIGLMTFLQLSCINPILASAVEIFESAGSYDEYMSTIIVGAVGASASLLPIFVVDKFGRRVLLLVSITMVTLSLVSFGLYFYLKKYQEEFALENLSWLPLVSLLCYVISCSIGLAPLPWVIVGETVPPSAKGISSAFINMWSRIIGFLVLYFFRDIMNILGQHGGYWLIASVCTLGFIFIFFFVPETKGKSLDEIQLLFVKKPSKLKKHEINK